MASGGGGNFQSLLDHSVTFGYNVSCLITDRYCGALIRAKENNIKNIFLNKKLFFRDFFDRLDTAIPINTDLVVLAGFMPILPGWLCDKWNGNIINIHPSLLPNHGGLGMYGVHVQESVLKNRDIYAGCTVHFVTSDIDSGQIIAQTKIAVDPMESAWELGARVFIEEVKLLPLMVHQLMKTRLI